MPLSYKDFFPAVIKSGFVFSKHEPLPDTVARAGDWIIKAGVQIINVETVVLPGIRNVEEASEFGSTSRGENITEWCQVVRVWYDSRNSTSELHSPSEPA